jgi:hypothetical protein
MSEPDSPSLAASSSAAANIGPWRVEELLNTMIADRRLAASVFTAQQMLIQVRGTSVGNTDAQTAKSRIVIIVVPQTLNEGIELQCRPCAFLQSRCIELFVDTDGRKEIVAAQQRENDGQRIQVESINRTGCIQVRLADRLSHMTSVIELQRLNRSSLRHHTAVIVCKTLTLHRVHVLHALAFT